MRSEGRALEQSLATLEDEYGEIWDQILTLPYKVLGNLKFTHLPTHFVSCHLLQRPQCYVMQKLNASLKSGEVRAIDAVRAYQWAALKRFGRAYNVCQVIAIDGSRSAK